MQRRSKINLPRILHRLVFSLPLDKFCNIDLDTNRMNHLVPKHVYKSEVGERIMKGQDSGEAKKKGGKMAEKDRPLIAGCKLHICNFC